ncbi:MFS transporter [Kitasatospora sp. NPDC051853]|uniref:MFS transporter n=1 Tax=Kitasatospora sp. NPDC051853 TaxID=3364058 RepID=UPI00378C0F36
MTSRQRAVLLLLLGSAFLLAADFSLLNVAIPAIGSGLGFSVENLQWIATSFAITAAGFTLLFGRVGDLYGRRRFFLGGIALLVAASVLGGVATTPEVLIAARVLQGLATAIATPTALSLLTIAFPEGPLRAKALGLNGAMIAAGFTVGAVVGGLLTALLSWRWAFLINVPAGLAILIATPLLLSESRASDRAKLDVPGAVTVSLGLVSLVYGVSRAGEEGWSDPASLVLIAVGALLLVAFWLIELRAKAPLAPVRILRKPTVLWGNLGGFVTITMQTAVIFLITVYLQKVLNYSALSTGLAFGGLGVASFLGGVLAPKVIGRFGNRNGLFAGMLIQLLAAASLYLIGESRSGFVLVLAALAVGAFGHLTAVVSYMVTATSGLPNEEQGLATGLATMAQQVALAVGIPVISAVAATRIHALEATESATRAVLGGVRLALLIDAGVVLIGAVLVWSFLKRAEAARAE